MVDKTAYFRDVNVGGETYIYNAQDGDQWTATGALDNLNITWPTIRFYSYYQGYTNCFVGPNWIAYNTTSIIIIWYYNLRNQNSTDCPPTGNFSMNFWYRNINVSNIWSWFWGDQFTILPQVDPAFLPDPIDQCSIPGGYDTLCNYKFYFEGIKIYNKALNCFGSGFICIYYFNFPYTPFPVIICATGNPCCTISEWGCRLVSLTMLLGYHLQQPMTSTDVTDLNDWLNDNNGFDFRGNIKDQAIVKYAKDQLNLDLYSDIPLERENPSNGPFDDELRRRICLYGPQIIAPGFTTPPQGEKLYSHFVLAYGYDKDTGHVLILDPWKGRGPDDPDANLYDGTVDDKCVNPEEFWSYHNTFKSIHPFMGPEYTYTDLSGVVIRFHSPGELLITDPMGRKTGLDPISGIYYQEIPDSSYTKTMLKDLSEDDPGDATKILTILLPLDGEYNLEAIGTGDGYYSLEIDAYDTDLNSSSVDFKLIPIAPGVKHSYNFDYSKTVGSTIDVSGTFDGKGQRPRDVNKFLSYINPSQVTTTLSAGTSSFLLMVVYGEAIIPSTFTATLNGQDVTSLFNPVPGTNETVLLNLQNGRNVLKLSVDGNLSRRVATDTDRLVFVVK